MCLVFSCECECIWICVVFGSRHCLFQRFLLFPVLCLVPFAPAPLKVVLFCKRDLTANLGLFGTC